MAESSQDERYMTGLDSPSPPSTTSPREPPQDDRFGKSSVTALPLRASSPKKERSKEPDRERHIAMVQSKSGGDHSRRSNNKPSATSANGMTKTHHKFHPYDNDSRNSSNSSMSHGNLLDTSRLAAGFEQPVEKRHRSKEKEKPKIVRSEWDAPEDVGSRSTPDLDTELSFKSNSLPPVVPEQPLDKRSNKPVFGALLSRTQSIRTDKAPSASRPPKPKLENRHLNATSRERSFPSSNLRTAPVEQEPTFREMMNESSAHRNRSADRAAVDSDDEGSNLGRSTNGPNQGSSFLHNFMQGSSKAADGINRAGNRFFSRFGRSGSSNEREPSQTGNEGYAVKVVNKSLREQTRMTRIRKDIKEAKDKTEYWMPALPYRCIDYLNHHGVEIEGLYRVPGSDKEVKYWQRKFDTGPDFDVDLLDDNIELNDINVIGSLLKKWLREIPDELFPKSEQNRLAAEYKDAEEPPQAMCDALSNLPPYNYYVLFAITCHISLLHNHSDKNKMDFSNLCICLLPSIKIERWCFKFLVCDWCKCWQGCRTERDYWETEMAELKAAEDAQMAADPNGVGSGSQTVVPSGNNSRSFVGSPGGPSEERSASVSGASTSRPPVVSNSPDAGRSTTHSKSRSEGRMLEQRHKVPASSSAAKEALSKSGATSSAKGSPKPREHTEDSQQQEQRPPSTPPSSTAPSLGPVPAISPVRLS
ncbi:MAG: hypothetical protein M1831_002460 [Alyxoria varia]|nr:MAG: hypothetical protein M1831_002460 [Alyxoria varia]